MELQVLVEVAVLCYRTFTGLADFASVLNLQYDPFPSLLSLPSTLGSHCLPPGLYWILKSIFCKTVRVLAFLKSLQLFPLSKVNYPCLWARHIKLLLGSPFASSTSFLITCYTISLHFLPVPHCFVPLCLCFCFCKCCALYLINHLVDIYNHFMCCCCFILVLPWPSP